MAPTRAVTAEVPTTGWGRARSPSATLRAPSRRPSSAPCGGSTRTWDTRRARTWSAVCAWQELLPRPSA
eukprot:641257-Alexandrium_andersonii.AAC.1